MSDSGASMERESFPPGMHNAFVFSNLNAISFHIVMASPMILYAKALGASATVLGIIAGMMPLLIIFQIPAASYVARVGYKKFVYAGWGTRVMFIFLMGLVPLLGFFINAQAQLGLLLFLLFAFNLSRGISSCAWLPWITALVPEILRGKYLARDAAYVNVGACAAFLISGFVLGEDPQAWQFAFIFIVSAVAGSWSLTFLKRIPDVEISPEARTSTQPVPWLAMLGYGPFRRLLEMNVAWSIAYGGIAAFTVAFLRSETSLAEGSILYISSVFYIGGLSSLWLMGHRLDRVGSKPTLAVGCLVWLALIAVWTLIAGGLLEPGLSLVLALQFVMGLAAAMVNMSNTRLAMVVIPKMGRNHFFALYSVVANVTLGLAPVGWGILIDAFSGVTESWGEFVWNRFSVFYACAGLVFLATLMTIRRLQEATATTTEKLIRELVMDSPQRIISYVRNRL
ncbi:MAG TPA: MFS transporter [Methylomirabilota bacterium]|nr:MFS transporter [Methylomirabilota bacterium]